MIARMLAVTLLLVGFGFAPVTASAQERNTVQIVEPWARASIGTSRPAAAYLTAQNKGRETVWLVGVETPVAVRAEIHRIIRDGDVLSMQSAGDVEIPPAGSVTLAPGGLHVMLMNLRQPIVRGSEFPLVLRFSNGERLEVTVPVMGPGARGPEK
tara:strand:+ start:26669 stop:27133 length:465 start_codon:yes stop_codon:yes gene_type:complete